MLPNTKICYYVYKRNQRFIIDNRLNSYGKLSNWGTLGGYVEPPKLQCFTDDLKAPVAS